MTITRKDLQEDIKHLQASNYSLVYENKKLKEIISLYEKFVSVTNRQTLHRDLGRIREFAEKKLEKSNI
tara:strand:+ start:802 stop:1008 length:207 start_codon:yes stop_codon:yes gene_type:complete